MEVESENIFAEHFSVPGHKYLYMAMMYLYSKKIKPTAMSLMEVLSDQQAKDAVNELGGLEYVTMMSESNVPPENMKIFIEKLKQSYTRRTLYNVAKETMAFVISDKAEVLNPAELVSYIEEKIGDLAVNTTSSDEVYKMGTDTEAVLAERAETRLPSQDLK
jgi:replicative DNA helicase